MAKRTTWGKKKPEDFQKTCSGSKMSSIITEQAEIAGRGCFAERCHAWAVNVADGSSSLETADPEGPHFPPEMAVRFASCY